MGVGIRNGLRGPLGLYMLSSAPLGSDPLRSRYQVMRYWGSPLLLYEFLVRQIILGGSDGAPYP